MLKGVPSSETRVEELWQNKAIWTLKCEVKWIADGIATGSLAGGTAQKRQQTWESDNTVRRSSHQGGSPQNGLGDERTCKTTLASAYVLRRLSATWLQLQMKERKSKWK